MDVNGIRDLAFYRHELFRLTTVSGEKYALDLTSAQHGYYEPIIPWNSYEKLRVGKVSGKVLSFGGTQIDEWARKNKSSVEQEKSAVFGCFTAYLNMTLQHWQINNTSFNTLLTRPDEEFERQRSDLYAHVGVDLKRFVPTIYKRNAGGR